MENYEQEYQYYYDMASRIKKKIAQVDRALEINKERKNFLEKELEEVNNRKRKIREMKKRSKGDFNE
jgi:predicted  nucleic acid-binding Zn-ribbon protein